MLTLMPIVNETEKIEIREHLADQGVTAEKVIEILEDLYAQVGDPNEKVSFSVARAVDMSTGGAFDTGEEYTDLKLIATGKISKNGDRYVFGDGVMVNFDALLNIIKSA